MVITVQVDMNLIAVTAIKEEDDDDDDDERIIKIFRFRRWLVPIVNAVLEEFEQTYHLLHCFPDVRSL